MKDPKGHGSNKRGGGDTGFGWAMTKVQQARMAAKAAKSPDSWEARYGTQADRDRLSADAINEGVDAGFKSSRKEAGLSDSDAASTLASGPKSAPVPVHDAHNGGGSWVPRDVAARFKQERREKKQFASAKREINRLKKRGK